MKLLKEIIADTLFRLSKPRIREIQGFKIFINTHEPSYTFRKTLRRYDKIESHEPATTELFKSIIKQGDTVVDIGANVGYFSLLAKSLGAERVFAFEPEPKNFDYLTDNINLNGYNIMARSCAISNNFGTAKLYLCGYDSGHHTLNQNEGITEYRKVSLLRKFLDLFKKEKYIELRMERLDDMIKERVDVIKMDCEGSELLALKGMDRILKENQDIQMIVEFFPLLLEKMGSSPKEFIDKILSYGFKVNIIPHDYDAGEEIKVEDYQILMRFLPDKESHLNLYLHK